MVNFEYENISAEIQIAKVIPRNLEQVLASERLRGEVTLAVTTTSTKLSLLLKGLSFMY